MTLNSDVYFRIKSSKSEPTSDSATGSDARVPYPVDWAIHGGRDIRDHFCLAKVAEEAIRCVFDDNSGIILQISS